MKKMQKETGNQSTGIKKETQNRLEKEKQNRGIKKEK